MKTVLISLMTMLGVAVGNAGVTATDLLGDIFSEVGASYSNLSTSNGLATRDESFGYSATAAIPVEGIDLNIGIDLHDVDGGWEKDWSLSFARPVELFGQKLGLEASYKNIDSSFGAWDQVGLGVTYSHSVADVTTSLWRELGSNGSYGVEFLVSRDFDTPIENLTVTPFVAVNVAEEHSAVEAGVSAAYDWNGITLFLKGSYNDNDVDASNAHSLENEWHFGGGVSYKF